MFSHKTQNFSDKDNDNLNNRYHFKIILGNSVLRYCLNYFFLGTFFALN